MDKLDWTPRRWIWRCLAAIVLLFAVGMLSACQTVDLPAGPQHYDRPEPMVMNGAPGAPNMIPVAQRINAYHYHQVPVRLASGTYSSAGTMWLFIVETVPGSCIERDTLFRFHGSTDTVVSFFLPIPVRTSGELRRPADNTMAQAYNPALERWYWYEVASRDSTSYIILSGATLIDIFQYEECT